MAAQVIKEERSAAPEVPAFQPPKKKKKWGKRLVIGLAVVGVLGGLAARSMLGAGRELISAVYQTQAAQLRDMTVSVSSTGTVTPSDTYRASAAVMGDVLDAPFEVGGYVEKGAVLYRMDAKDAQTAVAQAELALRQAQLAYDNTSVNQTVTAGVGGVVQKVYVVKGDMAAAGSPIADISDTSTMTLDVMFHSADAQSLSAGQQAVVTVDGTMETLSGTVETVAGADQVGAGGTLLRQVRIRVANPGALTAEKSGTASVNGVDCAAGGQFAANSRQTVTALSSGEVTAVHVTPGTPVQAGTALVSLGGTAAKTTLENAALAVENAKLSLQRARDALDNYVITAPISGTVVEKNFEVGDTVDSASLSAAGGSMAVIFDLSTQNFEMKINELDINKIQAGQEVEITADAVEGVTFQGVVDKVNINGTTVSGMTDYRVTVNILDPSGLKPGMNVSADVIIERVGEVLAVPVEAVNRGAEKPYVLVAGAGALNEAGQVADPSKLERREVTLGRNDDSYIEITQGLAQNEVVVWENEVSNPFAAMMTGGMGG